MNKLVLLLRRAFHPNEHMDSWERFNEATTDKKAFHIELYL